MLVRTRRCTEMFRRAQQQQPPRDRIAQQQQMAGSSEFQCQPSPRQDGARPQMGDQNRGARAGQDSIRRHSDAAGDR
jgi:hypothetical protein